MCYPDHRWLFTSGNSKSNLWDLKAADPAVAPVILHNDVAGPIKLASFSPDGNWLAVSSIGEVWLWNLRDLNSKPLILKGDTNLQIESMDISADSHWLVTSLITTSLTNDVRMWDLTAGNPAASAVTIPVLDYFDQAAFSRFDPDRQWLILLNTIGDKRGDVALWSTKRQSLLEQACRAAGRNLSESEWKQYFPDKPYRKTCPDLPAGK